MNLTIRDVLLPVEGKEIQDYFVYVVFFMALITIALLGNKSPTLHTALIGLVMLFALMDKAYAWGYVIEPETITVNKAFYEANPDLDREERVRVHTIHLGTWLMRVGMIVCPLAVIGSTKVGRVRTLTGIMVLLGVLYAAFRWFTEQREAEDPVLSWFIQEGAPHIMMQGAVFILILGELAYRGYRHWLAGVNRH